MERQYNVAIYDENKTAWDKIAGVVQRILPYNRGNPSGWVFSYEQVSDAGNCIVFKSLKRETAELVYETLDELDDLRLIPIVEVPRE